MFARLSAFVIWSLVAATVVFWALRFGVASAKAPAHAVAIGKAPPPRGDLARLFGAPPVMVAAVESVPEATSRFRLVGVMAPRSARTETSGEYGLALIAVDGKPPRAYTVGASLDTDLVLQSVGLRSAAIGAPKGPRSVLLELPALPEPATGVLGTTGSSGSNGSAGTMIGTPVPPAIGMRSQPVPPALPSMSAPVAPIPTPAQQQLQPLQPPDGTKLPARDSLATQ